MASEIFAITDISLCALQARHLCNIQFNPDLFCSMLLIYSPPTVGHRRSGLKSRENQRPRTVQQLVSKSSLMNWEASHGSAGCWGIGLVGGCGGGSIATASRNPEVSLNKGGD